MNASSSSPQVRAALAAEVEQLRESLVGEANTTYLGRPVFGGLVQGDRAYDASGSFVGIQGPVQRNIGDGVRVRVNVDGPTAFGPEGSGLFANLSSLASALRSGDVAGVRAAVDGLGTDHGRLTSTLADVGTKQTRLEKAGQAAKDAALNMASTLSELENVDVAQASMDLQLGSVAYQVALAATAKVVQPSLADFLR
jgi:flagellar hook-associated protein 3 FlgL